MSDPTATDVTHGFDDDTFAGVDQHILDAVSHLLARVSERSYRRGFQQGESISRRRPGDVRADLAAWRYDYSTDDAPWADGARIETASDRLFTENPGLSRLGLKVPMHDAIVLPLRFDPTYVASAS